MKKRFIPMLAVSIFAISLLGCTDKQEPASPDVEVIGSDVTDEELEDADETTISQDNSGADTEETSAADSSSSSEYSEPSGKEITVDASTRKKMNVFLSNFSEAGLTEYDKDNRDLHAILWWAHTWSNINKNEFLEYHQLKDKKYEFFETRISLDNLNFITDKYLGFTFKDEDLKGVKTENGELRSFFYEDGYLYLPGGDGEAYTGFSLISKVEDLGDDRLKLYYNSYSLDLDAYLSGKEIDYSLTQEEASKDSDYEKNEAGYAVVRVEDSTYKLEHLE
ncbi:MAG: hypothetical protein K6D38_11665 [Pseudobutyrivibrio sp.]|nr:hypothetical protein [Pseudobutyrivibrio sp.]